MKKIKIEEHLDVKILVGLSPTSCEGARRRKDDAAKVT
jgi:hypothetical protein